jgi:hypothetical protein
MPMTPTLDSNGPQGRRTAPVATIP